MSKISASSEPATSVQEQAWTSDMQQGQADCSSDARAAELTGWGADVIDDDFEYVPVSPWAPAALVMGLLSLTGFMGLFGLYIAAFSTFLGFAAVSRIRAAGGEVKGRVTAVLGLALAILSLSLGSAKQVYAYSNEVPDGYRRVNFPKEIADQQFIYVGGRRKIPPVVAPLLGSKVYLKGFMWATQATEGLTRFILLKDNGECCFGGKPKSHDFITVTLRSYPDGQRPELADRARGMSDKTLSSEEQQALGAEFVNQLTTKAFIGKVAVAGILAADPAAGEGAGEDYEYAPVYTMDAELIEEAWTSF